MDEDFFIKYRSLFDDTSVPVQSKKDPYKCERCGSDLVIDNKEIVCSMCGTVYGHEYEFDTNLQNNYKYVKKGYQRVVHLSRIIKKLNCTRRSVKDNLDFKNIVKKYKIKKSDSIDTVMHKIKNYKINHYCILNYFKPNYIFIDYDLQNKIFCIYNRIITIYYSKIAKRFKRRNFLNNYFVLKKILLMLGKDEISNHIHCLKVKQNLMKYNTIWNEIMKYY